MANIWQVAQHGDAKEKLPINVAVEIIFSAIDFLVRNFKYLVPSLFN